MNISLPVVCSLAFAPLSFTDSGMASDVMRSHMFSENLSFGLSVEAGLMVQVREDLDSERDDFTESIISEIKIEVEKRFGARVTVGGATPLSTPFSDRCDFLVAETKVDFEPGVWVASGRIAYQLIREGSVSESMKGIISNTSRVANLWGYGSRDEAVVECKKKLVRKVVSVVESAILPSSSINL